MSEFALRIESDGSIEQLQRELEAMPRGIQKAKTLALKNSLHREQAKWITSTGY